MTEKEKFNVAVAAFEALLSKHGLWEEYFLGFRKTWLYGNNEDNYTRWKTWAINHKMHVWVSSALEWDKTRSGVDNWIRLNNMWLTWICTNLNN